MFGPRISRFWYAVAAATSGVQALITPTEVYTGGFNSSDTKVLLRIATGGAGQSGLVKVLADAFIQESVSNGSQPFSIGWVVIEAPNYWAYRAIVHCTRTWPVKVLSDTTFTIKNLQSGEADLGISYVPAAEKVASDQGIIDPNTYYLFRDHFIITGPPENPANITDTMDATSIFARLFQTADLNSATTPVPTRFLSRYDKSATNLKESELWLGIGQVPWALPYSTWYHQFVAFPIQALTTAILLKEYTLTDRGTYLSLQGNLISETEIYKAATDNEDDPLLNPAHLLVGRKASNETLAYLFADWATGPNGQGVITNFRKNGQQLYSGAP